MHLSARYGAEPEDGGVRQMAERFLSQTMVVLALLAMAIAVPADRGQAADLQPLEIVTAGGVHNFMVEFVDTDETRAKGLMFRKHMPEWQGMLFDFEREQDIAMWMESTYISLDMLFIRADGRILRIAENTEPLSRRTIPSGGPVLAVLEVNAGTARRLGIAPGDRVAHPLFRRR